MLASVGPDNARPENAHAEIQTAPDLSPARPRRHRRLGPRGFAQPVEGGADVLVPGYDRPAP